MSVQSTQMNLHKIKRLHFVGIGGSGMNGIAQVLLNQGYEISGSDLAENASTQLLKKSGATIFVGHDASHIKGADVVVVSTAVKSDNPEVLAAKLSRIPIIPRAEMLAEIMRFHFGIAIAGTHGKTTTTSLVSSVLAEAGLDPTYVIGGRLNSSGSNAKLGQSKYFVAEADESDASFLYLQPMIAVVTNIDVDHMETYGNDVSKLYETFNSFLHHLPFYGIAILCIDDPGVRMILDQVTRRVITYGFDKTADIRAPDIQPKGLVTHFTAKRFNGLKDLKITLNLPGNHNILNALSVIAIAAELGIDDHTLQIALSQFSGVGRRCQVLGEFKTPKGNITLIDDYGHHPREIAATQQAIKAAYPNQRLITVFQPHRYSRIKALFEDFAEVLSNTEFLILLDIYAAGEEPILGISTRELCSNIRQRGKTDPVFVQEHDKLFSTIMDIAKDGDVILMQGAGNIGTLAQSMVKEFEDQ